MAETTPSGNDRSDRPLRILAALTYYRPYISGLTIYAERLARALVRRGHAVTVLAMCHDPSLPLDEVVDGVRIVRAPVLTRLGKGLVAPAFTARAAGLLRSADLLHLHLPQFDAAAVALIGRAQRVPIVVTYQCDLSLPHGAFNSTAEAALRVLDRVAGALAARVVTNTQDYSDHSPYLRRFRAKLQIIPPPVELASVDAAMVQRFRAQRLPQGKAPIIAMVARLSAEKGVEVLLDALPRILAVHPGACIVFAGPYRSVPGEGAYFERLRPRIDALVAAGHWRFLDVLDDESIAALYASIDLLVVPSVNSTESFGLVQIEAMTLGVPCVASDLPGIRHAVQTTGLGALFPTGDAAALARAVGVVLQRRSGRGAARPDIAAQYDPLRAAERYEALFRSVLAARS
jgi:glycosyltransferase involved in cell wall biosynthesis